MNVVFGVGIIAVRCTDHFFLCVWVYRLGDTDLNLGASWGTVGGNFFGYTVKGQFGIRQ